MEKDDKILILGARGLVGSSIIRRLKTSGFQNLLTPTHSDLELKNQSEVGDYFSTHRPKHIFLAAAKVGGIKANNTYRADFIFENLQIQNHVFDAAFKNNVDRFLFLGSSCIYPRSCPQPIREDYLLTAPLEATNEPYAIAKIAGLKTAENFRRQYGKNYFSIMPTNLYGINDNFDAENSHVIPGLIARLQKIMDKGGKQFEVWGSGEPRREFLYVDDMADACLFMMTQPNLTHVPDWVNAGTGEDITIRELADMIAYKMGFKGEIVFNRNYPDGTPRKLLDVSRLKKLGWSPKVSLSEGLDMTIDHFRKTGIARGFK